jgi:hypothetical protein
MDILDLLETKTELEVIPGKDGRDGLTVKYSLMDVTRDALSELRRLSEIEDDDTEAHFEAAANVLVGLQLEWNLTRGGEPVPCTKAGMATVPGKALFLIMRAILEGNRPNQPKPASSGAG